MINTVIINLNSPCIITSRHRRGRGIRSKNRENTSGRSKRKWEDNIKVELPEIECAVVDKIILAK